MTRTRVWFLTILVALALGINFDRLSLRLAQSQEDAVHARLASGSATLRAQIELRDARLSARLAATSPDLLDALRPPADPTLPVPRPDEKALRAAAAALQPVEPDLLIVGTPDGAVYSRRGKPATMVDEVKDLPLVRATLDGAPATPSFLRFDNSLFRVQGARIPGSVGVVVVGVLIDDRFASQLASATETSVTFFREGAIVASSLPEPSRAALTSWSKTQDLGYGTVPLHIPVIGGGLDGTFPRYASLYSTRATRAPFESGTLAVLTISANQYFGWLGRYETFYAIGWIVLLIFGFIWGILPGGEKRKAAPVVALVNPIPARVAEAASRAEATLAGANDAAPKPTAPQELPWTEGDAGWGNLGKAAGPRAEPLDVAPAEGPAVVVIQQSIENKIELHIDKQAEKVEGAPFDSAGTPPPPPPPSGVFDLSAIAAAKDADKKPVALATNDVFSLESLRAPKAGADPVESSSKSAGGDGWDANDPFAPQGVRPEGPASSGNAAAQEFSFGSLLGEQPPEPTVIATVPRELLRREEPEFTNPGVPDAETMKRARGDSDAVFPGDEPTRIEAVSAALLDKLREKDEGDPVRTSTPRERPPAPVAVEPAPYSPPPISSAPAFSEPPSVMQNEMTMESEPVMPGLPALSDADEAHFEETYRKFVELRKETGEPPDKVTFEKFAAKLRKNREELLAKHSARGVRFSVYLKDGRAAIKASAIR